MKGQRKKTLRKGIFLTCLLAIAVLAVILQSDLIHNEPYHLIFISKTIDPTNKFWTSLIDGAELGAQEMGVKLEVLGGRTEEDMEGQIEKIRQSILKRPDAILVAPCDYAQTSDVLQEVSDSGIKLILLDSVIDRDIADGIVSTDNYLAGRELGKYVQGFLDENSVLGIVGHVRGTSTAIERENGIREGLGTFERQVKKVVFCGSSYEKAYVQTVDMLREYPDMNMLIGTNEYAAVGAGRAIRDMGLTGKVKIVGFDNSVEEIQFLEEGIFQGLVIQKPFNMGYLGVEQAIKVIEGKEREKNLDSGFELITPDNMYEEENQRLLYPFSGQQ